MEILYSGFPVLIAGFLVGILLTKKRKQNGITQFRKYHLGVYVKTDNLTGLTRKNRVGRCMQLQYLPQTTHFSILDVFQ
jgi:hypothetical protein